MGGRRFTHGSFMAWEYSRPGQTPRPPVRCEIQPCYNPWDAKEEPKGIFRGMGLHHGLLRGITPPANSS